MTPRVARTEHEMLALARALIARGDLGAVMLVRSRELPPAIGPTAAALLEDSLRQLWPALWHREGARQGPGGRIWERHAPAPLVHTAATVALLRWLSATSGDAPLAAAPLAIGDQVMIYLALDAADHVQRTAIARQPMVQAAPLAWLGFADVMSGVRPLRDGAGPVVPPFTSLLDGAGPIVIEALLGELARRWRTVELTKPAISAPEKLIALGAAQDAVLAGFMAACDRSRGLAGFVIDAAAPVLAGAASPVPRELDPRAPLAQRQAARVAAGALLRAVVRWRTWDDQHRAIRFIDDGYPEAQRLLAAFERIGRAGADRAAAWLDDMAALAPSAGAATLGAAATTAGVPGVP